MEYIANIVIASLTSLISGVMLAVIGTIKKWFSAGKNTIFYDSKVFKCFKVYALWNPSKENFKNNQITKEFKCLDIQKQTIINCVNTTNSDLRDIIFWKVGSILMKFKEFLSKDGVVFETNLDLKVLFDSGEVNNLNLQDFKKFRSSKFKENAFILLGIVLALAAVLSFMFTMMMRGIESTNNINIHISNFDSWIIAIAVFIIILTVSGILVRKIYNKIFYEIYYMPKAIRKSFYGDRSVDKKILKRGCLNGMKKYLCEYFNKQKTFKSRESK